MSTETQVTAPAPRKPATIRDHIESPAFSDAVAKVLPAILPPARFVRIAVTALIKTPKLAECDQGSLLNSLLQLAQYGLEPDGRRAHLIPYGKTCQLVIDYKGLAELALRSGLVSYLHADIVCENDEFEYNLGEIVRHKVDFKKPRGAAYAFYAICRFKDGTTKADVMHREDVDAIRKRSRAGGSGPWVTDYNEMAKKTVFRRLSKWLPLSPELRDAVEKDDDVIDVANEARAEKIVSGLTAREEPLDPFAAMASSAAAETEEAKA